MDGKLNFVKQLRAFYQKGLGTLKPSAIALYLSVFAVANEAGNGGVLQSVRIDNERLMKMSGIGTKHTLFLHRQILCELGFIEYEKGGQFVDGLRISGKYSLIKLYKN